MLMQHCWKHKINYMHMIEINMTSIDYFLKLDRYKHKNLKSKAGSGFALAEEHAACSSRTATEKKCKH